MYVVHLCLYICVCGTFVIYLRYICDIMTEATEEGSSRNTLLKVPLPYIFMCFNNVLIVLMCSKYHYHAYSCALTI